MYRTTFITLPGRKHRIRVPKHMVQKPNRVRKNATKRLSNSKWRDLRGWALVEKKYACEECGDQANNVHHIQSVEEFPEKELDPTNLLVLCGKCHRKKHKELPDGMF